MANPSLKLQPVRRAILIEQHGSEFHVVELTITGDRVSSERRVEKAYWRDLAEQAATRALRSMGRK